MQAFADNEIQGGPEQPLWMELETKAYRDGPWLDAFLFRAMTWAFFLVFSLLGFGWHIAGVFFIGAGLLKAGIMTPEGAGLRKRLIAIGLVIGVPGAALAALLPAIAGITPVAMFGTSMLLFLCGPLVSLLYLCVLTQIAANARGGVALVLRVLSSVGRMALTNYIMHTVVFTFVFYWWGLGLFGQLDRPQRMALVPLLFAAQCIISPIWLSIFRFGPLEWLWRTLTYMRLQPVFAARETGASVT
jgi:uncharacterized protein